MARLERELSQGREELALATRLTQALGGIARQRQPGRVLAATVRTACETLGFSRAILFRSEFDGPRAVLFSDRGREFRPESAALSPASAPSFRAALVEGVTIGEASDLCAPLIDGRGPYLLSSLLHGREAYAFLYVDGGRIVATTIDAIAGLSAVAAVASRNALLFQHANELASRDALTGLLNRRALHERVERALAECARSAESLLYVLIDVDDFKAVNDRGGHFAGDAHLQRVAASLRSAARAGDVVARYAGDEFVVVMAGRAPSSARLAVGRLSEMLKRQSLSCSLGAAVYPRDGLDQATLARAADRALYGAKHAGKNTYAFA